jgi:hypothetical protein
MFVARRLHAWTTLMRFIVEAAFQVAKAAFEGEMRRHSVG